MKTPQQIVQALLDAGETQLSIERATGISQATVSRIAAGIAKDPRSSTVNKLKTYAAEVCGSASDAA
jgi:predicted transcriptional regulator